jgi:hypothetical protein
MVWTRLQRANEFIEFNQTFHVWLPSLRRFAAVRIIFKWHLEA